MIILALTFILLNIVALYIYNWVNVRFTYWTKRNVFHPKPSFPFGNFNYQLLTKSGETVQGIYKELKKSGLRYGGYNLLTSPIFMPLHPEVYKLILAKNFQNFHDHGLYYDEECDPMSGNLVCLPGAKWKYMRTKLSPTFTMNKIKTMFPLIQKSANELHVILDKYNSIDLYDLSTRYTTDVICSFAFGIECNSLQNPKAEFRQAGLQLVTLNLFGSLRMASAIMTSEISKFFNICLFDPKNTQFFYKIVEETITYRENNNVKRNDLMDLLIRLKHNESIDDDNLSNREENKSNESDLNVGLTLNQIAAQVFLFYLAGFETSAVTLAFTMHHLAIDHQIQDKIRAEILEQIESCPNGELTYEALANLKYTEQAINETLRMHPPIEMLNRICTQSFKIPDSDLVIEEGTRVVISTRGVHYDPEYYFEPETYNPDRFSEEEKEKRPAFTYFPFGDGPRICLGQKFAIIELKLALAALLKNHEYTLHPDTKEKIETISNGNMLKMKDNIILNVKRLT